MGDYLNDFKELTSALDIRQLSNIQTELNNIILDRLSSANKSIITSHLDTASVVDPVPVNDCVNYYEDFIDQTTSELLWAEIKSLEFSRKSPSNTVQNKFISSHPDPYVWPSASGPVVNTPLKLVDFPVVKTIMDKINKSYGYKVNSVLATYYKSGAVNARLHADDESTLDPDQPICVLSSGAVRRVEFVGNNDEAYRAPALTLDPADRSLYVMEAGCQTHFRHRVRANRRVTKERFSLSFRCFVPSSSPNSKLTTHVPSTPVVKSAAAATVEVNNNTPSSGGVAHEISPISSIKPSTDIRSNSATNWASFNSTFTKPKHDEKLCLLFGTSITSRVDGAMMSRGSRTVVNCSTSGARINHIKEEVLAFHDENPHSINKVDKIIFCLGTNEVKWFNCEKYSVNHCFRAPLVSLIREVKSLFPHAQIIFHCVLPIRIVYRHTTRSIELFNRLLLSVCKEFGCIYVDHCFEEFIENTYSEYFNEWCTNYRASLYWDNFHLNKEGLNVLCRALKYIVYHNIFNPLMR